MNRDAMINAAAQVLQDTEIDMDYVDRAAAILDAIHPELKPVPPAPAKTIGETITADLFEHLDGDHLRTLVHEIDNALAAQADAHKKAMADLRERCAEAAVDWYEDDDTSAKTSALQTSILTVPLEGGAK